MKCIFKGRKEKEEEEEKRRKEGKEGKRGRKEKKEEEEERDEERRKMHLTAIIFTEGANKRIIFTLMALYSH